MTAELRGNLLLGALRPPALRRIGQRIAVLDVAPGEVIQMPGVPGPSIDFPLAGLVSLVVNDPSGAAVAVGMVGREGATGLAAALSGIELQPEAVCTIRGRLARLPAEELADVVDRDDRFRGALLRYLGAQLVEDRLWSACNRLHPLDDRLARWLLCAAERSGLTVLPVTHEVLAQLLGASRPNVSAAVEAFARRGLVSTERGAVRVLDPDGLAAMSRQCFLTMSQATGRPGGVSDRVGPGSAGRLPTRLAVPRAARARGSRRRSPP